METVSVRGYVRKSDSEGKRAIKELKKILPKGKTVYTVLRGVSPSGMTRWVDMLYVKGSNIYRVPPAWVEKAFKDWPWKYDMHKEGWKVPGVGMDVGFELVYALSLRLYDDGYALGHRWI